MMDRWSFATAAVSSALLYCMIFLSTSSTSSSSSALTSPMRSRRSISSNSRFSSSDGDDSWALLTTSDDDSRSDSSSSSSSASSSSSSSQSSSSSSSSCHSIPTNLTLCHDIDYQRMRLPNLLNHESMEEVVQQSGSWVPLLRLACHPDSQLFLCSLFAPVCLDQKIEIVPCRSLCEAVKGGCENRMRIYGFPWPQMLNCSQFPLDNDMCIKPRTSAERNKTCRACSQINTYENILDHFCQSSIVLKAKLGRVSGNHVTIRRAKTLKSSSTDLMNSRNLRGLSMFFNQNRLNCPCTIPRKVRSKKFLVTATKTSTGHFVANLILPWEKNKRFKKATRMFRKLDCRTLGTQIRERARRENQKQRKTRRRQNSQ